MDLDLGVPALAVPADLAGKRPQLAHHEPVVLHDPARECRGTSPQHPVLAIDHDRGRRQRGQHGCDPWRYLGIISGIEEDRDDLLFVLIAERPRVERGEAAASPLDRSHRGHAVTPPGQA
jgi:hypothetical protein